MRLFQLTSKPRLVVGDARECEEAIPCLYSLDDFIAMGREELEQFDL
jgi:hypothetical protein